jgi:hypothetical protein
MELKATAHGFQFGNMLVEATAEIGERAIVTIKTSGGVVVDVYCSPAGKSVRFFRDGKELKAAPDGA